MGARGGGQGGYDYEIRRIIVPGGPMGTSTPELVAFLRAAGLNVWQDGSDHVWLVTSPTIRSDQPYSTAFTVRPGWSATATYPTENGTAELAGSPPDCVAFLIAVYRRQAQSGGSLAAAVAAVLADNPTRSLPQAPQVLKGGVGPGVRKAFDELSMFATLAAACGAGLIGLWAFRNAIGLLIPLVVVLVAGGWLVGRVERRLPVG